MPLLGAVTATYAVPDAGRDDVSTEDYKTVKASVLDLIERDWGTRCETKDTDDFIELRGKTEITEGRCPACVVYERFDKFWELFDELND